MGAQASPKIIRGCRDKKTEARIIAWHDEKECIIFYISILRDQSIVIGSSESDFKVRRINDNGDPIEGHDNIVDRPHATFHPPHFYHLRAERMPRVMAGLVWTDPEPNSGNFSSPWLEFTTSSLEKMTFREVTQQRSARKLPLFVNLPKTDVSLRIFADFISKNSFAVDKDYFMSKYFIAGDVTLRIRIAMLPPQHAAYVTFTAEG